ncbi:MoaD/ThiS family protein [Desulfallas sp. Bu1-1]|uniref:MoaD/ThiS family protein n=1 Tax=Desulfallas sp. Bu1-1 TaxID=2787620 RepID=UPI00189E1D29|nr:MoaD/ThiS family protein [Desulfallas sp. Bu1-1]MBF7081530.1 MoaD/ThiS family protein [Desulfallas sp. Bu1-1]
MNFDVTVDMGIALARHVVDEAYRKPKVNVRLPRGATLRQLVDRLGIPGDYISFVTVNGEKKTWDEKLNPGDKVILFPYITGG